MTTGTPGGGQESTFQSAMSTLAHHGVIFVPLVYKDANEYTMNLDEVHGGSPWGAGAYALRAPIPAFCPRRRADCSSRGRWFS